LPKGRCEKFGEFSLTLPSPRRGEGEPVKMKLKFPPPGWGRGRVGVIEEIFHSFPLPKGGWGDLFGNPKIRVCLEFNKGISVNRGVYSIIFWILILPLPGLAWAAEEKQEYKFDIS
jgi:hypothetical protein